MLLPITDENCMIYDQIVQDYEAEFAPITKKEPGPDGKYALDSTWRAPYNGYYWVVDGNNFRFLH